MTNLRHHRMTAIEAIEAATIPTTPINPSLRKEPQVTRTRAIRALFKSLGIRGVSATSDRGAGCFGTTVTFPGVRCSTAGANDHEYKSCPICQRNVAADQKATQIILAAFPDCDDRSDSQTDYFSAVFSVTVDETRGEEPTSPPAPPEGDVDPEFRKLSHFTSTQAVEVAPRKLELVAAEPVREESEPEYVATSQPEPPAATVERKFFGNAADIWTACRDVEKADREHVVVFFLDVRHRMIGERWLAALGTATGVDLNPREVYREALLRGAVSVIIAHNHPSGDPSPSRQDIEITRRLRGAAEMLGLSMLDHIVVGDCSFVSLASRGWS